MALARAVLKQAVSGADRLRPPPAGAVVLAYHRIGTANGSEIDLPRARFAEQMAALAASGRVCTLDDLAAALERGDRRAVDGRVAVTFDDGTADFVEHALPVLVAHRIPATLYVATRFVDEQVAFPWGAPPLSWAALAEATATGLVTAASHTHHHALLDRADPAGVAADLDRSIDLLAEHTGRRPEHFAYPKALPPAPAALAAVRSRFRTAALAGTRPNVVNATDLHRLARSPVQRSDGMRFFHAKLAGGMRAEDDLRMLVARVRLRRATV